KPERGTGFGSASADENWESAFSDTIAPEYLAAFRTSRTAMLVRDLVAEKYGWKIGDHIPLQLPVAQQNGSSDWAFDVVGTFTDSDIGGGRFIVIVSYSYFDEGRVRKKRNRNYFNLARLGPKPPPQVG